MIASKPKFVLVAAFVAALVGGAVTPAYAFLDKTRFVVHLGVAYFCFHHWVLKPFQAGDFNSGAPHRVSTIVKGGVALLFAYHEVKVADKIAQSSNDPLLKKLDGGLATLQTQFGAIGTKLKSGHFDPADVTALSTSTDAFKGTAAAENVNVQDKAPPVPIPGL